MDIGEMGDERLVVWVMTPGVVLLKRSVSVDEL